MRLFKDQLELMAKLKGMPETKDIPVLAMSALRDGAVRAGLAGADRFLPKPFRDDQLVDAVNQALGAKGIKRTDEMRRAREEMDSAVYREMSYYERWIASIEAILIEKKILTKEEIDRKLTEFEAKWGEP